MRTLSHAVVLAISLCATPVLAGPHGSLDLFNNAINPDGTAGAVDFNACGAPVTVLPDGLGRISFSLYARLAGATSGGIAGVECYIDGLETGLPSGWTVGVVYASGTTHDGDLVRPFVLGVDTFRRDTIVWPTVTSPEDPNCQGGVNSGNLSGLVFVARIDVTSPPGAGGTFTQQNRYISVVWSTPQTSPNECLYRTLILCNAPIYQRACGVSGGQFIINPNPSGRCTVAVESSTWAEVKSLYR